MSRPGDESTHPILGLRRPEELQPAPPPGDEPALRAEIEAEIRSTGPMTFARFMNLALYHPGLGYYASGRGDPGRDGDFLTAPETHPIFGWTVARQLEEAWERLGRPARFTVREHGAGTGSLAASIIEGLRRRGSPLIDALGYRVAEVSEGRAQRVAARLAPSDRAFLEADDLSPIVGVVIANEVIDALPVHRLEGAEDGTVRELYVALDAEGRLTTMAAAPSTPRLGARLAAEGIRLAPGQRAEVGLAADDWVAAAAAGLDRGLLMIIDYGHPATALYDPGRGSLLRAYVRHRVHDDPLVNIGRQDLTAHVDLTAVERGAVAAGLDHLGTTSQAAFLAGLGVGDLLAALRDDQATSPAEWTAAKAGLIRLIDPAVTGRFAVMLFGRGIAADPPLAGLSFRMPSTGGG